MPKKKYMLIAFGIKSITFAAAIALVYTMQSAMLKDQTPFDWLFSPITTVADYTQQLQDAHKNNQIGDLLTVHNDRGQTPLLYAIDQDDLERVEVLLSFGANPDMLDTGLYEGTSDNTPLHRAVYHGDSTNTIPIINALLQAGANPRLANDHGSTPLHLTGWITDSINNKNNDPAQIGRRMQVIDLLVNTGADLNAQDNQGKTLLHLLVDKRDADFMAQLIIRYGSLINRQVQDKNRRSAYEYAQRLFEPEPDDLLSALALPVMIIGANGNIKATDVQGNTGLMLAIMRDDKPMVAALLAAGADLNVQAKSGNTALHAAVLSREPLFYTKLLLSKGADPNRANAAGLIPLQLIPLISDNRMRHEMFDLLMKAGSDLFVRNLFGNTLLHEAVNKQDKALLERIIKQTNLNMQQYAALQNKVGDTAYDRARRLSLQEISKTLESYNK